MFKVIRIIFRMYPECYGYTCWIFMLLAGYLNIKVIQIVSGNFSDGIRIYY